MSFDDDDVDVPTKDSSGTVLKDGDSVQLIRDLNVKGRSRMPVREIDHRFADGISQKGLKII